MKPNWFLRVNVVAALTLLVVLAEIAGCEPQKVVVWSADGSSAAVIGGDGLYLCDSDGKLSDLIEPKAKQAAWVANTRKLIVETVTEAAKWKDVEPYLGDARRNQIVQTAGQWLEKAMAFKGTWKELQSWAGQEMETINMEDAVLMFLYVRDNRSEGLAQKFGADWQKAAAESVDVTRLQVLDVAKVLSGGRALAGPVIAISTGGFAELAVSPNGQALVAGVADSRTEGTCVLWAMPTDGKRPPVKVAEMAGRYPAWSADGHWLVYGQANPPRGKSGDSPRLGTLRRLELGEDGGRLKANPPLDEDKSVTNADGSVTNTYSPAQVLAGFVYSEWMRIHCTKDGRVLFASPQVTLPATADDMPTRQTLFAVDPGKRATVTRVLTRQAEEQLPDAVNQFQLSPDETRVAIPGTGGQVSVVTLADSTVTEVREKKGKDSPRMVPVWRNNQELCFAAPNDGEAAKKRAGEVVLWSSAGVRAISKAWPDEVVKGLKDQDRGPEKVEVKEPEKKEK